MKRVVLLFLTLLLSVFLGLWLQQQAGMLFIVLKNETIKMPLWFAILMVFLGYGFIGLCLRILTKLFQIKQTVKRLCKEWSARRAHLNTRRGLIEYSEGNWERAEQYFVKAVTKTSADSDTSLLNYLVAARAAQEMGESQRRDDYLREAQKTIPDAKIAIELTQAQLQMVDEQWEQALATLSHLHNLVPNHSYVTKLLMKVYITLKDWSHLEACLPQIRRQNILEKKEFEELENITYSGLLTQIPQPITEEILKNLWDSFPKYLRRRDSLIIVYVTQLIAVHAYCEAEYHARLALKRQWNNTLMLLYGQCNVSAVDEQLRFAESFLKYYPNNPYLLRALGNIYLRRQLWGKAKSFFSKSIQVQPEAEVYVALAKLSEKLSEKNEAGLYYKKGLELLTYSS